MMRLIILLFSLLLLPFLGLAEYCDESKCRTMNQESTIGYYWFLPPVTIDEENPLAGGYTCWSPIESSTSKEEDNSTNDTVFPCADGYYGHPIPNITKVETDNESSREYQWYTCCTFEEEPPEQQETPMKNIQQTCTDTNCISGDSCWAAPDGLAPKTCVDDSSRYIYPRDTGAYAEMNHGGKIYNVTQFLCCSEKSEEEEQASIDPNDRDGDLLDDNCSTDTCTSLNGFGGGDCFADGLTEPFTCDAESQFPYPSRNGHDDLNNFNFHYVCCNQPNYYADVLGEEQYHDGLHYALAIQSAISLVTFLVSGIFTLGILSNREVRSKGWNVYLIMLSIPDVLYNLVRVIYGITVITSSNTIIQTTWTIDWFYAVSNLLLNCVIVYQVHKFLRLIRTGAARIPPPTVKQVFINSFGCYLVAAGCGVWMFYLHVFGNDTIAGGSHDRFVQIHRISLICMVIPPIVFVTSVCIDVWYRKLLPKGGRNRVLAIYFLRVIFVFMVTWLPYMILITFGLRSSRILGYIGLCFASVQGTLSVLVALSKNDIRLACQDFMTCQCNNKDSQRARKRGSTNASLSQGRRISSQPESNTSSGYLRKNKSQGKIRISGISAELIARVTSADANSTASGIERSDRELSKGKSDDQDDQSQPLSISEVQDQQEQNQAEEIRSRSLVAREKEEEQQQQSSSSTTMTPTTDSLDSDVDHDEPSSPVNSDDENDGMQVWEGEGSEEFQVFNCC